MSTPETPTTSETLALELDSTETLALELDSTDDEKDFKPEAPLEKFLLALENEIPDSRALWQLASSQIREKYCSVLLRPENRVCSLEKVDGLCPYHKNSERDFYRRCSFLYNNGAECRSSILSRDLNVLWCLHHLNVPKQNVKLRRCGEYIVIKDTPYAVSDDLLSIIGRVKVDCSLNFTLIRERDLRMEEAAKAYGFVIRLD
jgi:hypothetical protein